MTIEKGRKKRQNGKSLRYPLLRLEVPSRETYHFEQHYLAQKIDVNIENQVTSHNSSIINSKTLIASLQAKTFTHNLEW